MSFPFSREEITRSWRPLNWQAFDPLDEVSRRYAEYYGLDFSSRLPDLEHGFGYFEAAGHTISVHGWRSSVSLARSELLWRWTAAESCLTTMPPLFAHRRLGEVARPRETRSLSI